MTQLSNPPLDVAHGLAIGQKRRLSPYWIIAICLALYLLPAVPVLFELGDEGTIIDGGVRVAEGQVPFRDFFDLIGPGSFYWLAIFFKLLGTTWFATRVAWFLVFFSTNLILVHLARSLGLGLEAVILFVTTSFPLAYTSSHHVDSNFLAILSFALFLRWIRTRHLSLIFLVGATVGLTACFMQHKGALLLLSFIAIMAISHRREPHFARSAMALAGGCVLVLASVVALYWSAGAIPDLIYTNIVWPATNYSSINHVPYGYGLKVYFWRPWYNALKAAFSPAPAVVVIGILTVPFLVVVALPFLLAFVAAVRRRRAFTHSTLPYWIAGFALWLSEAHRTDYVHLALGSPVLLLLGFYFAEGSQGRMARNCRQAVAVCAVFLAAVNLLLTLSARIRLNTRRGPVYVSAPDAVLDFLDSHTAPGDPVFLYPHLSVYYFLSATTNPTRYGALTYRMNTDAQFQEVTKSLDTARPRYAVWDQDFYATVARKVYPTYHDPPENTQVIERYLSEHYRVLGTARRGVAFLERRVREAGAEP